MNLRVFGSSLILAAFLHVLPAFAQQEEQESDVEIKEQALAWLDRFAVEQVLFHPEDVEKLRKKVAGMTPAEAADWWRETQIERELFDREEWQETREWLREFLRVQAIYTDEEIRRFQSEAFASAQQSARSLREVMDELTAKRRRLATSARQSAETRRQLLATRQAYRQDEVRSRESAIFQSGVTPPPIRRDPDRVRYNRPLVTSLDVARWTVLRELFPNW